jgi:hypothetical protein
MRESSLLQAGLSPALKADGRLLPIQLDGCGQDWNTGPRPVLRFAIWNTLSLEERRALGVKEIPAPADIGEVFSQT